MSKPGECRRKLDVTATLTKKDWLTVRDGLMSTMLNVWEPGGHKGSPAHRVAVTREALEALSLLKEMVPPAVRAAANRDHHAIMTRVRAARRAASVAEETNGRPQLPVPGFDS